MNILDVCRLAPVIPVVTLEDAGQAPELARTLVAAGLKALEITLRTPAALPALEAVAKAVPEAVVGAGTLLTAQDVQSAKDAGARFGVSPGATDRLLEAAADAGLPLLPGVATPSEAMRAAERGLEILKFFPAEQSGGRYSSSSRPNRAAARPHCAPGRAPCPACGSARPAALRPRPRPRTSRCPM